MDRRKKILLLAGKVKIPPLLPKVYETTEDGKFLITEDGKRIIKE